MRSLPHNQTLLCLIEPPVSIVARQDWSAENGSSKSLCLSLAMVIRLRARSMTQQSDWSDKLEHILADARIPKEQFATIENEST